MKRLLTPTMLPVLVLALVCGPAGAERPPAWLEPIVPGTGAEGAGAVACDGGHVPLLVPGEDCCLPLCCWCPCDRGLYAGAEFLLVRPHFSQAIAFVRGTQAAVLQTEAQPLGFSYQPSFRAFVGYRFGGDAGELRFTYWNFRGDTTEAGTAPAGQFIIDPFGNVVGTLVLPGPTLVPAGDFISTRAAVDMDVYDLAFIKPFHLTPPGWVLEWSAGLRVADVRQFYESVITTGGAFHSRGDFQVDFTGVGPRLGLEGRYHFGDEGRLSLFANGHGSLLLGHYDVRFSNTPAPANPLALSAVIQRERMLRTIPVMEIETGAAWQITPSLKFSAGWLFQAWFDLGTSGGTFGGLYGAADDANIMSFDGLFLRAELAF